jgi:hypothetical protein
LSSSQDSRFGKRKTVNMSEEVAQELNRLANLQGKTLYSLVNEAGMQAIEANRLGFSLEEAVAAKKLLQSAKRSRMLLVNQDLWYFSSSQAMKASEKSWLKLLRDIAQWEANVHLIKDRLEKSPSELAASVRTLVNEFFWDCSEMSLVEKTGGTENLVLRLAFVPEMPMEHTKTLFKFFEGMFNTHGYAAVNSTVEPGFLMISFKKVDQKTPATH